MDKEVLEQIEQIIGYQFSNPALLAKTFTHSSAVDNRLASNERLEFLGDSILGTVICQTLFERFPSRCEGELTKLKSMLVSRDACAQVARRLNLQKFLKVGKSMASSRALSRSLAAALLEAVIAAIYLDGGFDAARNFVLRAFDPLIEKADKEQAQGNYKSLLQQYAQERYNRMPVYVLLVSRETCAQVARRLSLQKFLKVGKSMASSRALFRSLAAALLEAVIAAIYLDGGFDAARDFILRVFDPLIEKADKEQAQGNYKSLLQQYAQERYSRMPVYVLLDEKGPDHDKCFESEVVIAERHFPSAWGTNKKEAEQKAAFKALMELGVLQGECLNS